MSTADRKRDGTAGGVLRYMATCWKLNLAGAMEFRVSFLLTAGMMFVNNCIWLAFWGIFFHRFPIVNGWRLEDVMLLWAVSAGGFGWSNMLFGNYTRVASIVANGDLDVYLSQPKPVLLNVLVSRMSLTAIGDFLFGLAVYAWVGEHTAGGAFRFVLALLISGLLYLFVTLAAGTLAFFMGNAEGLAGQAFVSLVALSTYPTDIFKGTARVLLFTVLPAGFISYMPIGLLDGTDRGFLWGALGMTLLAGAAATGMFRLGLRRYSSGNRMDLRS